MVKTTAELKAESENLIKIQVENHMDMWWTYEGTDDHKMIEECIRVTMEATKESLSIRIAEDVGKCELVDMEEEDDDLECKDRPEPQKCEGCKRALKIKRWLE